MRSRLALAIFLGISSLSQPFSVFAHAQAAASALAKAQGVTNADPQEMVEATVWLNLHNKTSLDASVANLYDPAPLIILGRRP